MRSARGSQFAVSAVLAAMLLAACSVLVPLDDLNSKGSGTGGAVASSVSTGGSPSGSSTTGSVSVSSAGGATGGNTSAAGGTAGAGGAGGGSGSGGAAGSGSVPTTGLLLWLAADVGVDAVGGNVQKWADQSPNANDATQGVPALQPKLEQASIGGLPAVHFDGRDDFLQLPSGFDDFGAGLSAFVVTLPGPVPTDCEVFFYLSNGGEVDDINVQRNIGAVEYEAVASHVKSGANVLGAGVPALVSIVQESNGFGTLKVNGSAVGSEQAMIPSLALRTANRIGAADYCSPFTGHIGELLLYDRALTAIEEDALRTYIASKWGCCN